MTAEDWAAVGLSLRVAVAATALALVPGIGVGWFLARSTSPLKAVVELATMLPLVVPPVVTGYALLLVLPRSVAFTGVAAVIASSIVGFPLLVQAVRVGVEAVSPRLLEAAAVDGAGRWRTFQHIVLPLAAPATIAGAALHFARALGEFGATIVVAGNIPGQTQTLPLALYSRLSQVGGEEAALRLAVVSVVVAAGSLVAYRWLLRRWSPA